jgi:hypothetical protein
MGGCCGGGMVEAQVAKVSIGSGNFTQSERLSFCIFGRKTNSERSTFINNTESLSKY